VRQIALGELQPHDESGAVITGEPNATIRVSSTPKQRIKSIDRVPAKAPAKARSPSVAAGPARGKGKSNPTPYAKRAAARSPSLVRQVVA